MTHTGYDARTTGIPADIPVAPEIRLARNRDILQQRLAGMRTESAAGTLGTFGHLARAALPLARRVVADNPYASLGGGMLAGMILMYWKPWRGVGGSLVVGLLVRQALALLASPGAHALDQMMALARAGLKSGRSRSS